MLPGKNILNLAALGTVVALTVWFVLDPYLWLLIAVTVLAVLLGVHLVASIRGGDMAGGDLDATATPAGPPPRQGIF